MTASTLTAEHLLDSLMYVIDPEVGINIVDHVIVGARPGMPHTYFSFREAGIV